MVFRNPGVPFRHGGPRFSVRLGEGRQLTQGAGEGTREVVHAQAEGMHVLGDLGEVLLGGEQEEVQALGRSDPDAISIDGSRPVVARDPPAGEFCFAGR